MAPIKITNSSKPISKACTKTMLSQNPDAKSKQNTQKREIERDI